MEIVQAQRTPVLTLYVANAQSTVIALNRIAEAGWHVYNVMDGETACDPCLFFIKGGSLSVGRILFSTNYEKEVP